MEPLIPFMLFLLTWNGEAPELTRHPVVYADEQECQAAGTALMLDHYGTAADLRFWCMPIPPDEEFDLLMQQFEAERANRRVERALQNE